MELKNDATWSSPTLVMMIWKEEARSKDFNISLNRRRKERSIGILSGDGDYILAQDLLIIPKSKEPSNVEVAEDRATIQMPINVVRDSTEDSNVTVVLNGGSKRNKVNAEVFVKGKTSRRGTGSNRSRYGQTTHTRPWH